MIDYDTLIPLARRLRDAGNSYRAIAQKLGVAETAVHKWVNTPDFKPPVRYSDEDKAQWAADADGTRTQAELVTLWGISDAEVQTRMGMLRTNGHPARVKAVSAQRTTAHGRYAELAKDIHDGITSAELATLWGLTVKGAYSVIYRMRDAGFDMSAVAEFGLRTVKAKKHRKRAPVAKPARPKAPKQPRKACPTAWLADCDGTRTMRDLATLWGVSYETARLRVRGAVKAGHEVQVAMGLSGNRQQERSVADIAPWMRELDGTRTSVEVCELWGVTIDTFNKRVRRLRDAGYHPEWASPPRRERAERKPQRPLPKLWPVGSSPAVEPAPIIEEPEHPKPAPYVGIANPPSRWTALGLRNVLDVPWSAFDAGVRVAFGWTLRPETLLEDDDATAIVTLFGVAVRSAA